MALLGKAALAMWWQVPVEAREELAHWHAHEHFPERLAIPGFLRASRWTALDDADDGFFVMYELQDHAVLSSAPYAARLNAPTPWSTRMMPLHHDMVRAQCHVVHSEGAVTARYAFTLRCAPAPGQGPAFQEALAALAASASQRPGIVGMHVLRHEAPALASTTEQRIRGNADRAADGVVLLCGYDLDALRAFVHAELAEARLGARGAAPGREAQWHRLAYAAVPPDVR